MGTGRACIKGWEEDEEACLAKASWALRDKHVRGRCRQLRALLGEASWAPGQGFSAFSPRLPGGPGMGAGGPMNSLNL